MRQLVLLRHAIAEDGHGRRDFDRELTPPGRVAATRVGAWLAANGLRPDDAFSSPAPRALETANLACAELGLSPDQVRSDPTLYDCSAHTLLHKLGALPPTATRILLVGHNPGLEQLALHLTGDEDLEVRGLATAGLVIMDLPDEWSDLGAKTAANWRIVAPGDLQSAPGDP